MSVALRGAVLGDRAEDEAERLSGEIAAAWAKEAQAWPRRPSLARVLVRGRGAEDRGDIGRYIGRDIGTIGTLEGDIGRGIGTIGT